MSDPNFPDKLSECINNFLKKPDVFNKIEKVQFYIGSFVLISSIIGITGILINYSNSNEINKLNKKIKDTELSIKDNLTLSRTLILNLTENKINQLKDKMYNLFEDNINSLYEIQNSLNIIENLTIMKIVKKDTISVSSSVQSFVSESELTSDTEIGSESESESETDLEIPDKSIISNREESTYDDDEIYKNIPTNETTIKGYIKGFGWLFN